MSSSSPGPPSQFCLGLDPAVSLDLNIYLILNILQT